MLLRIDCPDCGAEYAWQTVDKSVLASVKVAVFLYCMTCDHVGGAEADHVTEAAATALKVYRIQTTAKEESA